MLDVLVVGAGPAGIMAALRAGELGARTALVTRGEFGGMAANEGPIPVRTLAHAARLLRDARQLQRYGISVGDPVLEYSRLLARTRDIVAEVSKYATRRSDLDRMGVAVHERTGPARFVDAHTIETPQGPRLQAEKIILCAGTTSRRLAVDGADLTVSHTEAWRMTEVPSSMLVIGGGASGVQVASIFAAFGSRVHLFQAGPRILPADDEEVSAAVASAFRQQGIVVREKCTIHSFEKTPHGVQMHFSSDGARESAEAALAVTTIGAVADTAGLDLATAGVDVDPRGFVRVNAYQQTSAKHIYAAGDITGQLMLVPQAIHAGLVASTNAVRGPTLSSTKSVSPIGSFTDPEFAQVGLTESKAREHHEVIVVKIPFDETARTIIDGHTFGFCKLIVDRTTRLILGCHVVGERAVEITQVVAVAMTANMPVEQLAQIPLSFPTYAGMIGRAAQTASRQLAV
jgi:pyruvate/2-oxoglutarate dehydrogenase complex dihydrolipoamide dehydrogenase (E3) component